MTVWVICPACAEEWEVSFDYEPADSSVALSDSMFIGDDVRCAVCGYALSTKEREDAEARALSKLTDLDP